MQKGRAALHVSLTNYAIALKSGWSVQLATSCPKWLITGMFPGEKLFPMPSHLPGIWYVICGLEASQQHCCSASA